MPVVLDDTVFKALRKVLLKLSRKRVRVGVLSSKGGNAMHDDEFTLIELAALHEFGSEDGHIKERSFIRSAFDGRFPRGTTELKQVTAKLYEAVINGRMTETQALEMLGAWGVGTVQANIKAGVKPDIKEATKRRKGSDKPLIDTGRLRQSINWDVT